MTFLDFFQDCGRVEFAALHTKLIQAVRSRRGCAAHGGHGRAEWGRRFALFARFAVLAGQGTAKDATGNFETLHLYFVTALGKEGNAWI